MTRFLISALLLLTFSLFNRAQVPGGRDSSSSIAVRSGFDPSKRVTISIGIRDSRGLPLDDKATVRLFSLSRGFSKTLPADQNSTANFNDVLQGSYEVEVLCPGYLPVRDRVDVAVGGNSNSFFSAYIFLHSVNEPVQAKNPSTGLVLTPKLAKEIDKGLELMHKGQFDNAKLQFEKAAKISPNSSDILYLLGTAELGLANKDVARQYFQRAVALDPSNGRALVSLGELQLQSGDSNAAIATLKQAFSANGSGWRTEYLLASAYAKSGNILEGEKSAIRAAKLAGSASAAPLLLLGDIQAASGEWADAQKSWELLVFTFPAAPEVASARKKISEAAGRPNFPSVPAAVASMLAAEPDLAPVLEDRSWAPPDIDSAEYSVAPDVSCNFDQVIGRAEDRLKSQLQNLEKFGATEHIEHQEIAKSGVPEPPKFHDFYYLVFIVPDKTNADSVFLEESRDGGYGLSDFPTSLATRGLNSLGISVLSLRQGFTYRCEGLANIRGEAAWQVHFEQKKNANVDVRLWNRNGKLYSVPLKGRFWLSSNSYDLLRVESDLREPILELQLSRDHLEVDYGPVNFLGGSSQLWLPWSAEMYMELHGRRYHHKHLLTNYILFGVDTTNKIAQPKDAAAKTPPPIPVQGLETQPAPTSEQPQQTPN